MTFLPFSVCFSTSSIGTSTWKICLPCRRRRRGTRCWSSRASRSRSRCAARTLAIKGTQGLGEFVNGLLTGIGLLGLLGFVDFFLVLIQRNGLGLSGSNGSGFSRRRSVGLNICIVDGCVRFCGKVSDRFDRAAASSAAASEASTTGSSAGTASRFSRFSSSLMRCYSP